MRPPLNKRLNTAATEIPAPDSKSEGYAEKVKLAEHLHAQGVNPLRWTEAHPAPQAAQQQFQKTGQKVRDNQFEIGGKLYDWSPAVTATPAQAKAIAEAYVATPHDPGRERAAPRIEEIVDINRVPLKHPFGTLHLKRPANDMSAAEERTALFRHYAQSGVDPDKAHLGDPLVMTDQERLKAQIEKVLPGDKTEISGLPIFYQGFDDGWIYQTNAHTRESEEVERIRRNSAKRSDAGGKRPINDSDNAIATEDAVIQHYLNRDNAARVEGLEKGTDPSAGNIEEKSKVSEVGETSLKNRSFVDLQNATQNLPAIVGVIEKLQSGKSLTPDEEKIKGSISASLKKAGIEFDYTLSDPNQLREVYAQAQKSISSIRQDGDIDSSELAMAMLTLRGTQALAGGNLDYVRMLQADNALETFSLALGRFMPVARKVADPAITALNVDAAMDGPIDYEAAYQEFRDLFVSNSSSSAENVPELTAAETINAASPGRLKATIDSSTGKTDVETFKNKLTTFDEVAIHVGDAVLMQHPHTTATDQIFIEELLDVASSKGCDPEPEPTKDRPDKEAVHGGKEPQRRITDVEKPGHQGSAQPDADVTLGGHGNRGAVYFGSVSTRSDGLRLLGREIRSAYNTLNVMIKQLGASPDVLDKLANPVKAEGHLFLYRKKWGWELDKIREDIRAKISKAFDTYYDDCLPNGPPSIIDLDGVGD